MNNIKLIVSEVDGVLTDGKVAIDELSNRVFKNFNTDDLEVVNRLKSNVPLVFISSDNAVTYNLFRKKHLSFFWAKKDKKQVFLQILRKYNVSADEVLYIASKLSDLDCAYLAGTVLCPSNVNKALASVGQKLESKMGEGVLTEIYLMYFR
jgi:3-deoxy-D-manno-octulosonate 8-phosphate phosphatase (KDO 8-P phosphatase)